MLESLTSFLTGSFLLNKVDSLHGGRRCFPDVKNILFHFILNKVYSFWVEKIKLVNIFIFPELDFVRKADVPPWTKKELKEQRINLWITGNDKVAQSPWPDTRESETVKD